MKEGTEYFIELLRDTTQEEYERLCKVCENPANQDLWDSMHFQQGKCKAFEEVLKWLRYKAEKK